MVSASLSNHSSKLRYENRGGSDFEGVNLRERQLFLAGKKHIAIISDAASTGLSIVTALPRHCNVIATLLSDIDATVMPVSS